MKSKEGGVHDRAFLEMAIRLLRGKDQGSLPESHRMGFEMPALSMLVVYRRYRAS